MPRLDGIDVSHHQGVIDWPRVHRGLRPVIVGMKATQGSSFRDPRFGVNRVGAAPARYRLIYHWLSPRSSHSIAAQVGHLLRTVGQLAVGEGIMLDVEEDGVTVEDAREAAGLIEATTRRPVAIYTGAFFAGGSVWDSTRLHDHGRARIFAAYTTEARARSYAAPFTWDVWQFTSKAAVDGVLTPVDGLQLDDRAALDLVCGHMAPVPWPRFDPRTGHDWGLWPIGAKPTIIQGATGDVVRYLQGVIFHKAGGRITIDGKWGDETTRRVLDLRKVFGLSAIPVADRQTWGAIDYLAMRR